MNGKNNQLYLPRKKIPPLHLNRTEAVICVKIQHVTTVWLL